MDADTLKGIAVVSLAEGTRLGRVEDLLFATQPLRVAAFEARGDGQTFVIPFDRVRSIGADAVTIESSQVIQAASTGAAGSLIGLERLKALKVVDAAGTFIGTINHVHFEPATGQVLDFTVHRGGVLGIGGTTTTIRPEAVLSVGPELLTVEVVQPSERGEQG